MARSAPPRRRRFRFSLNTLAIQVSAFALSFMLVALLVVGSSRAAFVEENETVTERVPVGLPAAEPGAGPSVPEVPVPSRPPRPTPAPTPVPEPTAVAPAPVRIDLSDDSSGTAMFSDADGLAPGVPEERCIQVTFRGDADPQAVRLYASQVAGALAPYLDLTVQMGPPGVGSFGDCGSFVPDVTLFEGSLAGFGADHAAYDSGMPTWDPAGPGESRSFRFTVTVQDDPAAEGLSAGFGLSWEARA